MLQGNVTLGGVDLFSTYGIYSVTFDGGMRSETFGASRKIQSIKSESGKQFFGGFEDVPLSFELTFATSTPWDSTNRKNFAKLLFKEQYQELYQNDDPNVIYNVIADGEPKIFLNQSNQGYVVVKFVCDASHAWTPKVDHVIDATSATVGTPVNLVINNNGSSLNDYYPEIEIQTVGVTEFRMYQETDGDLDFHITPLVSGETVFIDNELKRVVGDQAYPNNYRYANFNKNWIRLLEGSNTLRIVTASHVTVRTQFPVYI